MDYEDGMEEQHGHPDEDDNDHQHEQADNAPRVSQHIVLPAIINESKAYALYDPGSNASFISTSYARHHKIPMIPLAKTRKIGFADGDRPAARVTHCALVHVSIGREGAQHHEQLLVFMYDIQYDMILRLPWSEEHQPSVQWKRHTLVMDSARCSGFCNASYRPAIATSHKHVHKADLSASSAAIEDCDLREISAVAACAMAQQPGAQVFTMWVQPMTEDQEPTIGAHATSAEDFEKFMRGASDRDPREKLPYEYHDLVDAFSRKDAATLLLYRSTDHAIYLKEGTPPFRRPYNLSKIENDAVRH